MLNRNYSILVNGVIYNDDGKILISQRAFSEKHAAGKWTIPGGKVENDTRNTEIFNILEKTLKREIFEEVGIKIKDYMRMITNNTFQRTGGQSVLAITFLVKYKSGTPRALEDTINVAWISADDIDLYSFPPNVRGYIISAFDMLNNKDERIFR